MQSRIHRGFTFITVCLILLGLLPVPGAQAAADLQEGLSVTRNEIVLNFPNSLSFNLEASASEAVQKVYLNYGTAGRTCLQGTTRQALESDTDKQVTASWEWDFTQSGSLPPGVEIWWEWELLLDSGATLTVERTTYRLVDPRFTWRSLENERMTVNWTEGSSTFGQRLVEIAMSSLDRLEGELGIQMTEKIRLIIYPSADDIQGAILSLPEWTGGLANSQYNLVIIGIPPESLAWAEEVIPHEIAHLVLDTRTFNCVGINLPTWLAEGVATLAEGDLPAAEQELLLERLNEGSLPGLVTLASGFSADAGEARLSYQQSAAAVAYLLETYGPEKFAELLGVIQGGKNANPALLQVYGLDTAGLDKAWRASLGFETAPQQEKTATQPPTQIPTLALWTAAVKLTATPTATPLPSSTNTLLPPTATPTPATEAVLSPTPAETPEESKSPGCLGGLLLGVLSPSALLLALSYVLRAFRR